ncbi:hypothetical protein HGI30_15175 [Paenibacillus albicereus]|uniref:Uncharacterized protein n=1 Tax=Paenibacillus albicereus TaxID=2726185 RepID=A0A6H2GZB1_9BACL|nr:hypothetical protein [Paenibacillus albicereus]QJC52774.1 hypothetical protein HGI30_15175 [Paenibacillus albicereus]
MLKQLLRHLPTTRAKQADLNRASRRVSITIRSYREATREIQEEIERNGFARYLIYDKGE